MSESDIQQYIQLHGPYIDTWLLRNNSGALKDANGRLVRYGLGNTSKKVNDTMKSSDLIGIHEVTITPEMVGKKVGVFTAIEVKGSTFKPSEKDERYLAQRNFINLVTNKGGVGAVCKSKEEFNKVIEDYNAYLVR